MGSFPSPVGGAWENHLGMLRKASRMSIDNPSLDDLC